MARPYDLYIKFLITKGMNDLKEVNASLDELRIPRVDQDHYDLVYQGIKRSCPKGVLRQMEDRSPEKDFLKWMKILDVDEMWEGEKPYLVPTKKREIAVATSINDDQHLSLCVNALLMKGLRGKDITESVNPKFSAMLKIEHVEIYQKFFFNPQRMSRNDWKNYIAECSNKEKHIYFVALSEPLDILKTELELPTQVNVTEPLQFLLTKSYLKAKQYLSFSTKESNAEARAWINQVTALTDKYMKYKSSDTTDFAKTLQMEFDYVDTEFPSPDSETLKQLREELEVKDAN